MNFGLNWFDFLVAVVVLAGVNLGNKRGMSKEVIVFLQWCAIVVVAALFYAPIGQLLSHWTGLGEMTGYVLAYLLLAAVVKLIFSKINQRIGEKIEANHPFGRMEYYFGPVAGGVRFACVILLLLACSMRAGSRRRRMPKRRRTRRTFTAKCTSPPLV